MEVYRAASVHRADGVYLPPRMRIADTGTQRCRRELLWDVSGGSRCEGLWTGEGKDLDSLIRKCVNALID